MRFPTALITVLSFAVINADHNLRHNTATDSRKLADDDNASCPCYTHEELKSVDMTSCTRDADIGDIRVKAFIQEATNNFDQYQ